jgi:hypothetical protein
MAGVQHIFFGRIISNTVKPLHRTNALRCVSTEFALNCKDTVNTVDQMKRIAVNFRLEAELLELLKAVAKQKAISKTAMLEECLKATLSGAVGSNEDQKIPEKDATVASKKIQALLNEAVEQKFSTYFQETEKKIAQLQQDLADLRKSVN